MNKVQFLLFRHPPSVSKVTPHCKIKTPTSLDTKMEICKKTHPVLHARILGIWMPWTWARVLVCNEKLFSLYRLQMFALYVVVLFLLLIWNCSQQLVSGQYFKFLVQKISVKMTVPTGHLPYQAHYSLHILFSSAVEKVWKSSSFPQCFFYKRILIQKIYLNKHQKIASGNTSLSETREHGSTFTSVLQSVWAAYYQLSPFNYQLSPTASNQTFQQRSCRCKGEPQTITLMQTE